MISTISLEGLLPRVFAEDNTVRSRQSDVWLRKAVTFERGQVYMIKATSGTGKSSLCSYIYGDRHDYQGRIHFDGIDTASLSVARWCELRRRALGYMPQEMKLFPELTAIENVEIKNRLTHHFTHSHIVEMLESLELGDRINVAASRLSAGQQQRVAVVRALCQPFDFLLIDEPVSHLDEMNNAAVGQMIMDEAARQGAGVIATSVGNDIVLPTSVTTLEL